jgi:hypothetical protein
MPMTWMPAVSCAALPVYWRRLEACSRVVVGLCKAFDTQEECQNARAGGMARRLEGRHVRGRAGGREGPERGERDRKRGTRGKGNARLFFERMQARHKTYPFFFANSAAHSRHQEQAKRQAHGVCRSHAFLGASCAHSLARSIQGKRYIYGLFIEKTARLRRQKTLKAKTEPH